MPLTYQCGTESFVGAVSMGSSLAHTKCRVISFLPIYMSDCVVDMYIDCWC